MRKSVVRLSFAALVGLLVAVCFAEASHAQRAEVRAARDVGEYAGVRPGAGHHPPRAARAQRLATGRGGATVLTWPGFEPRGGGRFFLQTTGPIAHENIASEGRFEVLLRGARTHVRNTRRPLITRFFDTPVNEARIERRGRNDLAFVFLLKAATVPTVTEGTADNGYHYLYVDFPAQ